MRDSDASVSQFIRNMSNNLLAFNGTLGLLGQGLGKYFDIKSAQANRPDFSNVDNGQRTVDTKAEQEAEKKREEARKAREQAEKDFAQIQEQYLSRAKKLEEDIANIRKVGLAAGKSTAEIEAQVAAARKAFADAEAKHQKKDKKTDAQKAEESAQRELENLQKQVALTNTLADGETRVSEAARIRYETTEGAYKSASAATKAALVAAAEERDRQRDATEAAREHQKEVDETTAAYERLHDQLLTPSEGAFADVISQLDVLNKALQLAIENNDTLKQGQIRQDIAKAQDKSLFGDGPPPGIPQFGGAGDELARLAAVQAAEDADYQSRLQRLEAFRQTKAQSIEQYNADEERIEREHQDRLAQIDQSRQTVALNAASDFFGNLAQLQHSENSKIARIGKAAAIAQALVNTYQWPPPLTQHWPASPLLAQPWAPPPQQPPSQPAWPTSPRSARSPPTSTSAATPAPGAGSSQPASSTKASTSNRNTACASPAPWTSCATSTPRAWTRSMPGVVMPMAGLSARPAGRAWRRRAARAALAPSCKTPCACTCR